MEQQNQQQTANGTITTQDHMNNKATNTNNNGGFLCRQSSTRWTPTTDQIRILKELYYTNGMRSPSAEQIQRISARLRQYGKIEGKNVFYWFQNHKARERQKKRFTSDHHHLHNAMQRNSVTNNTSASMTSASTNSAWKPHDHQDYQPFHHPHIKYSNLSPVVPCGSTSSANVVGVNGQMGNYPYVYGGVTNLEKAFREQCGSSGANVGGSIAHNFGWVGSVDPYSSPYTLIDKRSTTGLDDDCNDGDDDDHDHDEDQSASPEIETLSLFPMHGEDIVAAGGYFSGGWYGSDEGRGGGGHVSSRTSLELSLNSYGHMSPDSL